MSIASRIEQIEQHISDDYDVLTLGGADLTNVDKNIQNLKTQWENRLKFYLANGLDVVWNNWNKITGSGTTLSLNNTIQAPMKIVYGGNTQQNGTPTPDDPVDINVVSGDNEINICGKNLFEDEYIDIPMAGRTNAYLITGTYTLASCDSNNFGKNIYFRLFDKNTKNMITSGGHLTSNQVSNFSTSSYSYYGGGGASAITFTLDNDYYLNIGLLDSDNTRQVMLVKGNSAIRTYEAFNGATYPINLPVENLINPSLFTISGSYNVTSINNGEVVGTSLSGYAGVRIALGKNVSLKTNDVIYVRLKMKSDVAGDVFNTIQLMDSSNAVITATETKVQTPQAKTEYQTYIMKFVITSANTLAKLFIQHKGSTSNVFTIKDIQVSYVNGSYTPYGTTPIELCKIGDYQDTIVKDNGKWYLNKKIGKVVLDGSENWSTSQYGTNSWALNNVISVVLDTTKIQIMSTKFKGVAKEDRNVTDSVIYTDSNTGFIIRNTPYTTKAEVQSGMSGTPIYYIPATPTTTEITDTTLISQLEAIKYSYDSQTNISQTPNDMPFELDITALGEI